MNNKKSVWTPERLDLAEKLWKDGNSATVIAARLPGISRNAVLGVMNRERARFPYRGGPAGVGRNIPMSPKEKVRKVATAKPVQPQKPKWQFEAQKATARLADLGIIARLPKPTAEARFPHRGAVLKGGAPNGVSFSSLSHWQCAWPLTNFEDADGPDMPCCGRRRRGEDAPNSAYCAEHAAVARGEGR
ncbi:GcrA family cell cycle regulator [Rhizobium leguminosarum]|uniref:GcrA family cell cycle regulator n=1 Tax=Rhizobium leguminosarum TaxID=384 RepID=UPI000B929265|nr:GcrA family cell cycle regulator [Rhizobium leguminosarum]ASS56864.1 hypothetical protein CHR56_21180 [Rhizobium leguminosarum bv. viciae]NEI89532.1 hypothetical protein [Rhizobium leguminosarum]